jgi:hypothetical protein
MYLPRTGTTPPALCVLEHRSWVASPVVNFPYAAKCRPRTPWTELSGLVEDMAVLGHAATARFIDRIVLAADASVAQHLALALGTRVMRIRRVRLASGVGVSLDQTYLPLEISDKIVTHALELERYRLQEAPLSGELIRFGTRLARRNPAGN